MAGVQAGRLSIEIVAEIARLQADLDKAKRAVNAASKDIAASAKHANDNLGGMARGITGAGNSSRLAAHHVQNLAFQFQDIGVSLASGQRPMTVFMQQGSQIAGIMTQAGIGVGGLAKQLGAMTVGFMAAHPVLTASAAALGLMAGAAGLMTSEINKNAEVTVTWQDTVLGAYDAVRAYLEGEAVAAFQYFGISVDDVWAKVVQATKTAMNIVIGVTTLVPRMLIASWDTIPGAVADIFITAANGAISAINDMVQRALAILNGFITAANTVLDKVGWGIGELSAPQIAALENNYAGAGRSAANAMMGAIGDTINRDFIGEGAEYLSPFAQARARERMAADAESAGKAAGGRAGRALGREAGKAAAEELRQSFEDAFQYIADELRALNQARGENARLNEAFEALEREAQAIGLVGWEREKLIRTLEYQSEVQAFLTQIAEAEAAGQALVVDELRKGLELRQRNHALEMQIGDATDRWDSEQKAIERVNAELRDMIGLLQGLGGVGNVLGGLLGLFSGQIDSIGGPLGAILNSTMLQQGDNGEEVIVRLGDELREIFGLNGPFGKTMTEVLQSAGIGMAAGQLVFGKQGTVGQLGSAIGGALGEKMGEKVLGKAFESIAKGLGDFAGPLGSIAGGILGGLVGKLLSGSKKGMTSVTGSGVGGYSGNAYAQESNSLAGSVFATLDQIAEALGGTLSGGSLSIGVRNGKIRVDPTGQGNTKTGKGAIDFGQDEAAALEYALRDLIADGVLTGISDAAKRLLSGGGDLEKQIEKALRFEGALKAFDQSTSPLSEAIKALNAEFAELTEIFTEAGATTEQFGQLQALQARELQKLIDEIGESYRSTFFSAEEELAYARNQISSTLSPLGFGEVDTVAEYRALVEGLDLTTEAGRNLYGTLMELVDAFGTVKDAEEQALLEAEVEAVQAATLATQRRELEIRLLEAQGNAVASLALRRAAELEAMDESLRALQMEIYLAEDIAAARDVLSEAYQRERSELDQTARKFRDFAATLKDFRDSLFSEGAGSYNATLARLMQVGALAKAGDETALGSLPGVSREYLDSAKDSAGSLQDYQRAVALVAGYVDGAIGAASGKATAAERQMAALDKSVEGLLELNDSVLSVDEAIERLTTLQEQQGLDTSALLAESVNRATALLEETKAENARADSRQVQMNDKLARIERVLSRWDADALPVRTLDGDTVAVSGTVTVESA